MKCDEIKYVFFREFNCCVCLELEESRQNGGENPRLCGGREKRTEGRAKREQRKGKRERERVGCVAV